MTTMRAKFIITSVEQFLASERVKFTAVGKAGKYPDSGFDEDNTYAQFTPSAICELTVANPELRGKFKPGDKFYVDFTPTAD